MNFAKKIKLIPAKNQQGGSIENSSESGSLTSNVEISNKIKNKFYDKIQRFLKVILKLARNVGYDSGLRIKLKNGKYLEKSNITDLLSHAMSVGKILYGENEFIELLANSNVDPDLIINDNVKLKLIQYLNKADVSEVTKKSFKRKMEEDNLDLTHKKRRYNDGSSDEMDYTPVMPNLKRKREMEAYEMDKWRIMQENLNKKRRHEDDEKAEDSEPEIDESLIDRSRWALPDD